MQMTPGMTAAACDGKRMGEKDGTKLGEKGKRADQPGRTYSEMAHLQLALLPSASGGSGGVQGMLQSSAVSKAAVKRSFNVSEERRNGTQLAAWPDRGWGSREPAEALSS